MLCERQGLVLVKVICRQVVSTDNACTVNQEIFMSTLVHCKSIITLVSPITMAPFSRLELIKFFSFLPRLTYFGMNAY